MPAEFLKEFKEYADFSVRVDRFFHLTSIYGWHHSGIKAMHARLPSPGQIQGVLDDSSINEDIRLFLSVAAFTLGLMATRGIFQDEDDQVGGDVSEDTLKFAFHTCYCFQWSLFEDFVRIMIQKTIDGGVLRTEVANRLKSKWGQTKQLLDMIERGEPFGASPFRSALPEPGWVRSTETCTYADLDEIRNIRNQLIHGVSNPELSSEDITSRQLRYDRSMWILRRFAENIQREVQQLLDNVDG